MKLVIKLGAADGGVMGAEEEPGEEGRLEGGGLGVKGGEEEVEGWVRKRIAGSLWFCGGGVKLGGEVLRLGEEGLELGNRCGPGGRRGCGVPLIAVDLRCIRHGLRAQGGLCHFLPLGLWCRRLWTASEASWAMPARTSLMVS